MKSVPVIRSRPSEERRIDYALIRELAAMGLYGSEIARALGCARATVYRVIREVAP